MLPGITMANLCVKITMTSGESVLIPLEETPKVSVADGNVMVAQKNNAVLEFPLADCPRFELYENTGVETTEASSQTISYEDGVIKLAGFRPGIRAAVHTISGIHVISGITDLNGSLSLDMGRITPGIYIISTPSINSKLVIK